MKTGFDKFQQVVRIREFATMSAGMQPIGQTVRVIGTKKSVDVNIANYIKNGMKPQTVCRWLQFLRMVIE